MNSSKTGAILTEYSSLSTVTVDKDDAWTALIFHEESRQIAAGGFLYARDSPAREIRESGVIVTVRVKHSSADVSLVDTAN